MADIGSETGGRILIYNPTVQNVSKESKYLSVVQTMPLGRGGHEEKNLLILEDGGKAVEKIIDPRLSTPEKYFEDWNDLKKAGVNTVSSMFIGKREDGKTGVVMTYGRGAFYGKEVLNDLSAIVRKETSEEDRQTLLQRYDNFKRPEDYVFMAINPDELESELLDQADKMTAAGRLYPPDDPMEFFVPTSSADRSRPMVWDLTRIQKPIEGQDVADLNRGDASGMVLTLHMIQGRIIEVRENYSL